MNDVFIAALLTYLAGMFVGFVFGMIVMYLDIFWG